MGAVLEAVLMTRGAKSQEERSGKGLEWGFYRAAWVAEGSGMGCFDTDEAQSLHSLGQTIGL